MAPLLDRTRSIERSRWTRHKPRAALGQCRSREVEVRKVNTTASRQGWASRELPAPGATPAGGMEPLLDAILEHVPPPAGDPAAPLALLVAMVERDAFLGPIATGRIAHGTARPGDSVRVLPHAGAVARLPPGPPPDGEQRWACRGCCRSGGSYCVVLCAAMRAGRRRADSAAMRARRRAGGAGPVVRLTRIWKRVGTGRQDMAAAGAGDIVSLTGAGGAAIADTVAGLQRAEPLAPGPIEPPTLRRATARTRWAAGSLGWHRRL